MSDRLPKKCIVLASAAQKQGPGSPPISHLTLPTFQSFVQSTADLLFPPPTEKAFRPLPPLADLATILNIPLDAIMHALALILRLRTLTHAIPLSLASAPILLPALVVGIKVRGGKLDLEKWSAFLHVPLRTLLELEVTLMSILGESLEVSAKEWDALIALFLRDKRNRPWPSVFVPRRPEAEHSSLPQS
ncbi:hypothetical protein BJ684DRAFT_15051 [Piptocephalis cylindrospora]|uniref:Uncharacterized protein n=1 Tax=Piptocephalis cylindrospora TaxID=1907219 RepID=A0A4P9Y7C4_9FUNG|nr:hypothetical protein BJ684DRAFT_15051 [Piptocephalis cylindrospora]|eukprot:RKP14624.1 hypothetical protein BJ684DRAFT_15051 [Piptocephalis cylindrospora]